MLVFKFVRLYLGLFLGGYIMKKLLAFVFTILSLISVNLFAVRIHDVVDNGNGEYTVQRTSRGVEHTFLRAVDGTWTELFGDVLSPKPVSSSFAKTLNASLEAYILGKNAYQHPLTAQPSSQQSSQSPQPVPGQAAAAPQPQQEAKEEGEDDVNMGMDVTPVGDDPVSAAGLAGELEHKRHRGDEVAAGLQDEVSAGAPQTKRKIIDYAEIGHLASIIFTRPQQQPEPAQEAPVLGGQQAQQAAGQQVEQEEVMKRNRIARAQALLESQYKKNQEQCILM